MNDFKISGGARTKHQVTLGDGTSVTLTAGTHDLQLSLDSGRLWLTRTTRSVHTRPQRDRAELALAPTDLPACGAADVWLAAGQTLRLPRGSSWVAQAWSPASFTTRRADAAPTSPRQASTIGDARRLVSRLRAMLAGRARSTRSQAGLGATGVVGPDLGGVGCN